MEEFVISAFLLAPPVGYAALQIHALRRWRGGYRKAAWLSLIGWALWAANLCLDLWLDPTSHNLFPFEIALGALGSIAWLGLLAVWQWLFRPPLSA